jgi:hypothetical protein
MRFRLLRLTPLRREAVDQAPALGSTMIYPGNRPGVGASLMAAAVRVVTSPIEPRDLAFQDNDVMAVPSYGDHPACRHIGEKKQSHSDDRQSVASIS